MSSVSSTNTDVRSAMGSGIQLNDDLREFNSVELHDELPQRDDCCCSGSLPYGCNCGVQSS